MSECRRHLLNETLTQVLFLGITLVYVVWNIYLILFFIFRYNLQLLVRMLSTHTIYLVFADLKFSGVKSLSRTYNKLYIYSIKTNNIRCYTVCTHNRIRSPRLAAFGRIETRWVREVGKFGPYLRYKDWLRRRLLKLIFYLFLN